MRATSPAVLGAVAIGGASGALARYATAVAVGDGWGRDVAATLAVNLVGALAAGVAVAVVLDRAGSAPVLRGFLVTGFLGGFTTYSALALEVRDGLADHRVVATAAYLLASLVLGPLLARIGLALGRGRVRRARAAVEEPV